MPTAKLKIYDLVPDENGGYRVNDIAKVIYFEISGKDFIDDRKLLKHIKKKTNLIKKYARFNDFLVAAADIEQDNLVYIDYKGNPVCEIQFGGEI